MRPVGTDPIGWNWNCIQIATISQAWARYPYCCTLKASASGGRHRTQQGSSLLGIHSSRLDITAQDFSVDEALGLNCAWYADVLLTLTDV